MNTERTITKLPEKEEEIEPIRLAFFCKDCKKIIAAKQTKKKFVFACSICGGQNVAYGTALSIQNHYRLSESDMTVQS